MSQQRVVLIHGAATTPRIWDPLIALVKAGVPDTPLLVAPSRPSSGDLTTELNSLAAVARSAIVVGVSGGATLGLALLSSTIPIAGAVLHEPAVGTLCPGLLAHVVAGYDEGGVAGFGRALYGENWVVDMASEDSGAVARDLAMFRRFEPAAVAEGQGPVILTVGAQSPPMRHEAAAALASRFHLETEVLPESGHFVHHDNPAALAEVVLAMLDRTRSARLGRGQ